MPRALWNGAIAFGLVHIPVALYSGSSSDTIDFDWLDKRDMKPVGYKRVNKETGKEVAKDDIVRGFQYQKNRYVVLSDEEIQSANVKSTQSVDILAFVDAGDIPLTYFDTPYYLAPIQRGQKVYALLRETLERSQKVGIANVVIQAKQHLAALIPSGPLLILNTLRWAAEIRPYNELELPKETPRAAGLTAKELDMAEQLVADMTRKWDPNQYHDTFREDVMALVKRKIKTGGGESVVETPAREAPEPASNVVDLTALLRRSLRGAPGAQAKATGKNGESSGTKKASESASSASARKPAAKRKRA
jgi:DNA end-binding protein Ku